MFSSTKKYAFENSLSEILANTEGIWDILLIVCIIYINYSTENYSKI